MSRKKHHGGWVILTSLLVSLMLTIMPLPSWAVAWRPDWVALILLYWCIALPQRVGITSAWVVGIFEDILTDTLLGQHSLSLICLSYISVKLHRRIRAFPIWQQAVGVFALMLLSEILSVWIHSLLGAQHTDWSFSYPAFSSMFLWPWIFVMLRDIRRMYHVF
jgi:rod shape-determining protein MreD